MEKWKEIKLLFPIRKNVNDFDAKCSKTEYITEKGSVVNRVGGKT